MAGLRVFVSSTCYDLSLLRSQLRVFIQSLGYEPIMSDYEDVLYDPRKHTHTSCVDEVGNCDMVILIVGSRLGGKATADALLKIDFDKLKRENKSVEQLKQSGKLSITQLEVLKAIENGIPVYTFIEKKVWHDHELYEKNKNSEIIDKIVFPSIEKQETAKYIFEFINFVRLRAIGNNIFPFEKETDIEDALRKQWSGYFQRLLQEQRDMVDERKRMEQLTEQFENLKAAILSSIVNVDQREVARGIVKYRRLFDLLFTFKKLDQNYLKKTSDRWNELLEKIGIIEFIDASEYDREIFLRTRARLFLVCEDQTFYEMRLTKERFDEFGSEWESFISLQAKSREIIIETLCEMGRGVMFGRYVRKPFGEYIGGLENTKFKQLEIMDDTQTE